MNEFFLHHGQKYVYLLTDNKEFFISLILAVITFLAVIVALFGDWFRSLIFKPKLKFETVPSVPQVIKKEEKGIIIVEHYTMYRLLVRNIGSPARDVRALITNVVQPLNLYWTNIDKITRDISKKEPAYLDIIQEKNGKLYFYPWAEIIDLSDYKLSNSKPTEIKIEFFEKDRALQSVKIKLDPVAKTLKVL
jgi:hypothetical protein